MRLFRKNLDALYNHTIQKVVFMFFFENKIAHGKQLNNITIEHYSMIEFNICFDNQTIQKIVFYGYPKMEKNH